MAALPSTWRRKARRLIMTARVAKGSPSLKSFL
jgi:hypothetical protein